MRIAYFLTHPTQNQAPFIRTLRAHGMDVTVVFAAATDERGYYDTDFKTNVAWDVPLTEGYPHVVLEKSARVLPPKHGFLWYFRRLWVWLQENRPDIIFLHGWSHVYCRAVWTVAFILRIPLVLRGETSLESVRGSGIRQLFHRWLYSWSFRSVGGFVSIGTLNHQLYRAYGVPLARICRLPYCVEDAFFATCAAAAQDSREELRAKLGIAPGRPVLLFCGKLIEDKGVSTVVQALGRVAVDCKIKPVLLIAGDGGLRGELEEQAKTQCPECVRFLGFCNQTELPALYDLCDLFVLPSNFEPWGLVVNEAMAAGRAVIVSDRVGCRPDLLQDGVNGSIFHAGDANELARKITHWLADPAALVAAGARSREMMAAWRRRFDVGALRAFFNALAGGVAQQLHESDG